MRYPLKVWLEIRRLYVEEGRGATEISKIYSGKPTRRAIVRRAAQPDEYSKTWKDYRVAHAEEQMLARTGSQSLMVKILSQIDRLVSDEHFDASKADQLSKLTKTFREIVDDRYHIQVFFTFAHDFVGYLAQHYPELLTAELLDAIRDFKGFVKTRINLGEPTRTKESSEGRPRAPVLRLLDSGADEDG